MKITFNALILILTVFTLSSCVTHQAKDITVYEDPEESIHPEDLEGSGAYYHYTKAKLYFYEKKFFQSLHQLRLAEEFDMESPKIKYDMGMTYLKLGMDQNAIKKFEETKKVDPENPLPYKTLGRIYTATKKKDDIKYGKEQLLKAIELNEDDHEVYLYLAINSVYSGDISEAKKLLATSLKKNKNDARVYYYQGSIAIHEEDYETAETYLYKSLEINPNYYPAFVSLVDVLEKNNKIDEAIYQYEKAIRTFPLTKELFISYGALLYRNNIPEEALIQFQNAEVIDASDMDIKYRIGLLYVELNEHEKSIEVFNKILSAHPDHDRSKYYIAINYIEIKNYEEAESFLLEIGTDSDLYTDVVVQRAYIHEINKNYDKAIEILEAEYNADKSNSTIVNFLGSVYRRLGMHNDSIELYNDYLKQFPNDENILYSLGVSHYYNDEVFKSLQVMNKIIQIYPENVDAINFIGYTYAERGENLEYAKTLILKALSIEPDKGYIIDSLGWIYYKKGDYDAALKYLLKAVNLSPDDPAIIEHLADTYLKKGKKDLATENYKKALDIILSSDNYIPEDEDLKSRLERKVKEIKLDEV